MIDFVKYHGTGNDFIMVDDRNNRLDLSSKEIERICDRHFGIGADGLIVIRNKKDFDFEMLYYNSDGGKSSMCGNGGRCAVAFTHSLGLIKDQSRFIAFDGPHNAKIKSQDPMIISLQMNDVIIEEVNDKFIIADTGSPHYVCFVDDVKKTDVVYEGRSIRNSIRYKRDGINVNFVEENGTVLNVRTYERGVEDETLSCGTGVTASVLAAAIAGKKIISGQQVITPGGMLNVFFKRDGNKFSDIWLEGPAEAVFSGRY